MSSVSDDVTNAARELFAIVITTSNCIRKKIHFLFVEEPKYLINYLKASLSTLFLTGGFFSKENSTFAALVTVFQTNIAEEC